MIDEGQRTPEQEAQLQQSLKSIGLGIVFILGLCVHSLFSMFRLGGTGVAGRGRRICARRKGCGQGNDWKFSIPSL